MKLDDQEEIREKCAVYVAATNLNVTHYEHEATKKHYQFIASKCGVSDLSIFTPSKYFVKKAFQNINDRAKQFIKTHGNQLAENGNIGIMIDHWYTRRMTHEPERNYLGVIINLCSQNGNMVVLPILFEPVSSTAKDLTLENVYEILDKYNLTDAFKKNLIGVCSDNALYTTLKQHSPMAISCNSHNMALAMKRLVQKECLKITGFKTEFASDFKESFTFLLRACPKNYIFFSLRACFKNILFNEL